MIFCAELQHVDLELFNYWLTRDWWELFPAHVTYADGSEERNTQILVAYGREAFEQAYHIDTEEYGPDAASLWVAMFRRDRLYLEFYEWQEGAFVGKFSTWLKNRFTAEVTPVTKPRRRQLSEGEMQELKDVQSVFMLYMVDGLSMREIGLKLGKDDSTLRRHKDKFIELGYQVNWPPTRPGRR